MYVLSFCCPDLSFGKSTEEFVLFVQHSYLSSDTGQKGYESHERYNLGKKKYAFLNNDNYHKLKKKFILFWFDLIRSSTSADQ